MSIAYFLVTATYMTIGAAFYVAFPLPKVNCTIADRTRMYLYRIANP